MKFIHKSENGTVFHLDANQPSDNKVVEVTRKGNVSEEQFANDIKELVLEKTKLFKGKTELRVVG